MATEKQIAAARLNGAKSHGPTSPAGKARSSQNARKHGLSGGNSCVLIEGENEDLFEAQCDHYVKRFQPADEVEADLVLEMVQAAWRLRRARSIENSLIEIEMLTTEQKHPEYQNIDFNSLQALAYKDLNDSGTSLSVLNRYASRLHREFHRALKTLRVLQAERTTQPDPQQIVNTDMPKEPAVNLATQEPPAASVIPIQDLRIRQDAAPDRRHRLEEPFLPNEPDFTSSLPQPPALSRQSGLPEWL